MTVINTVSAVGSAGGQVLFLPVGWSSDWRLRVEVDFEFSSWVDSVVDSAGKIAYFNRDVSLDGEVAKYWQVRVIVKVEPVGVPGVICIPNRKVRFGRTVEVDEIGVPVFACASSREGQSRSPYRYR